MKNKKWVIVIGVIVILLVGIYFLSPMFTVHKFINAAAKGDREGMIACIEPETAKTFTSINNLVSSLGIDSILSGVLSGDTEASKEETNYFENKKFSFSDFKIDFGDKTSSIKINITSKDDSEDTTSMVVDFVWIDFKWYIKSISDFSW